MFCLVSGHYNFICTKRIKANIFRSVDDAPVAKGSWNFSINANIEDR